MSSLPRQAFAAVLSSCMFFTCATCAAAESVAASSTSAPPNIVFILADDLGYGDLGCYGQKYFSTPHLDRMAAEGMRFTQHYAGSSVCAPSRACLLTGQHTGHVYQRANGRLQFRDDPLDICVARRLKDVGYGTAMIGKSGLSCNSGDGALPNRKGFDYFFGFTSHEAAHRYYPPALWRNGNKISYPDNRGKEGNTYSGGLFLADTLDYLDQRAHSDDPFFLHVSLQQPHADLSVPAKWRDPFIGKYREEPFAGDHYRGEQFPKSTYAGMVAYLDHSVGKILDKIDELGLAENTLVLFSSDNGAMSEGGWNRDNFTSSGPLRGGKRDLYEGGLRVPLIARWRGTIEAGSMTDHVSAFWDFTPTACDLAGSAISEDSDGISYAPLLKGNRVAKEHEYLYWELYEEGGKQAVRWGDWKAVRLNVNHDLLGPLELYNLKSDPGELEDVSAQHKEIVERMKLFMDQAHRPGKITRFSGESAPVAASPETDG